MSRFKQIFILLIPYLLILSDCKKEKWEGRTYIENGCTVIENYGKGLWGEHINEKVEFVTELTLGELSGEEYLTFHTDIDVTVDSKGNIYVLDIRNHRIVKFDVNGDYLWTAGRQGQGPGEFQRPSKIKIMPSGEICVLDGSRKLLFYNSQGNYIHMVNLESSVSDFQFLPDRRLFMSTQMLQQAGLAGVFLSPDFVSIERFPAIDACISNVLFKA